MALKFPADFEKCVREGGRVKTINPKAGKYLHICYDKQGNSHSGEVMTKKEASEVKLYKLKTLSPQIAFNEKNFSSKKPVSEIEILHAGEWEHPQYGVIQITDEDIDRFISSFNDKVRKVDIAVDQEHMPEKGAAGWFKSMRKVFEDGKTKLKAGIEWTKLGTQLITDGIFKYFSPEFDFDYEDMETHEVFENVLLGGALTNRPYFKSLAPVLLSENMYAGFTSLNIMKGGEKKMSKEELKAKLVADAKFELSEDASEEEKKLFGEVKAEVAKEAEEKEKQEKAAVEAAEKKKKEDEEIAKKKKELADKKMSEQFISKAEHTKELNEMKSQMGVLEAKLRFKEVTEQVQGYIFSESNINGVLLPKNKDAAIKLIMALTPKAAGLFTEFVKGLPKVSAKLFKEEGGDSVSADDKQGKIEAEVAKKMKEKSMTYSDALKIVSAEKPELFKK